VAGYSTRYFLRRLAEARRNPRNANDSVPFTNAIVETTFVFVCAPALATLSVIGTAVLRFFPARVMNSFGVHPGLSIVIVIAVLLFGGQSWFRRRFAAYRKNPAACLDFDSARDREIIFWQRTGVLVICGILIPLLAVIGFLGF
jgi:hypothetical protein